MAHVINQGIANINHSHDLFDTVVTYMFIGLGVVALVIGTIKIALAFHYDVWRNRREVGKSVAIAILITIAADGLAVLTSGVGLGIYWCLLIAVIITGVIVWVITPERSMYERR